jgi:hypothetical protein
MIRRAAILASIVTVAAAPAAFACGGLIGPNGAVNLGRTTTLAAYHAGLEHYVTAFKFEGEGGEFGSLVPLPGIPSNVERGGDWTLQRLQRETQPPQPRVLAASSARATSAGSAEVLIEKKIDALDITVLKGGGAEVGEWAKEHGFRLPPDAPEVLQFYARRSPIFMAAVFDGKAAAERGQRIGDGTPIHLTIPTANPWVPLRILSLGKQGDLPVEADVYLLTDIRPALLPLRAEGFTLERRVPASQELLTDLRSDKGMDWVPASMWLTHFTLDAPAAKLRYDLAVDASGRGRPSRVAAGLPPRPTPRPTPPPTPVPTVAPSPSPAASVEALPPVRPASSRLPVLPFAALGVAGAAGLVTWRRARLR